MAEKICFCTDLDNTLIYSYRREIESDKVLRRHLIGKKLSFMQRKAYEILEETAIDKIVVPVTIRSLNQYRRIDLLSGITAGNIQYFNTEEFGYKLLETVRNY